MASIEYNSEWSSFFRGLMVRPESDDVATFTPDRAKQYIMDEIIHAADATNGTERISVGPFCLIGTSGVGKTQLVDQLQEELGKALGEPVVACKITAPNIHPDDITGIPVIVNSDEQERFVISDDERVPVRSMGVNAVFISPITDRMAKAGIIFIDELNRVPTTHHLNSLMNIILNHEILGQKLPNAFVTIVAVNPDWADSHLEVSSIEQGMAVRELDWAHRQRMVHRLRVVADVRPDILLREMDAESEDSAGLAGHLARTFADWWNHDLDHLQCANAEGQQARLNRMVSPRLLSAICRSLYWDIKARVNSPADRMEQSTRHWLQDVIGRKLRNFAVPIHPDDIRDSSWESAIVRLVKRLEGEGDIDLSAVMRDLDLIGFGQKENGVSRYEPSKVIDALEYLLKSEQCVPNQLYPYGLIIAYLMSERPWRSLEDDKKVEITERTQSMRSTIINKLFRNVKFMEFIVLHLHEIRADARQNTPRGENAKFWLKMIEELKNKALSEKRLGPAEVYFSAIEEVMWSMCGFFAIVNSARQKATSRVLSEVNQTVLPDLLRECAKDLKEMPSFSSDSPNYEASTVDFWELTARVNLKMAYRDDEVDFEAMHEAHKSAAISPTGEFPGESPEWTRKFFKKSPYEALAVCASRVDGYRPYNSILEANTTDEANESILQPADV